MSSLTTRQEVILGAVQLFDKFNLSSFEAVTGINRNTIREEIEELYAEKIIRPISILNLSIFGEHLLAIPCVLYHHSAKAKKAFIDKILELDEVDRVLEVFGDYHLLIFARTSSMESLLSVIQDLSSKTIGCTITGFAIRLERHFYTRRYINPENARKTPLTVCHRTRGSLDGKERYRVDERDREILSIIDKFKAAEPPRQVDLKKLTGFKSNSTLTARYEKLKRYGALVSYGYSVNPEKIGRRAYIIFITLRNKSDKVWERLHKQINEKGTSVVATARCVGTYDVIILLEVDKISNANKFMRGIFNRIGRHIAEHRTAAVVHEHCATCR